jgi:hypothetical protein
VSHLRLRLLLVIAVITMLLVPLGLSATGCGSASAQGCCKYCTIGQPCGDTCIAAWMTCHKDPGCACSGNNPPGVRPNAVLPP